jgi:Fe2+ transport system protein FeoA
LNPAIGVPEESENPSMMSTEVRLSEIALRETVELIRLDLPQDLAAPLLERGVLPGCRMCPMWRTPSGDPVVLVDGTLLALRREVANCLCVKRAAEEQ